ncbi:MAG: hypothetical protein ACE5GL_00035 [Calditrichia bacterium]
MINKTIHFRAVWILLWGIFLSIPTIVGAQPTQPNQSNPLLLRTVPIMDQYGWAQPVVAKTLLVPADWQVQGGIRWKVEDFSGCTGDMIEERFMATSPDGKIVFEILPNAFWQWSENPLSQTEIQMRGCRVAPPLDAQGVLNQYVIPTFRPGVNLREAKPSPEAAQGAYEDVYRLWGPLLQMQQGTLKTDAISAVIEYRQGERLYEERIALTTSVATAPTVLGPMYSCATLQIYTFRAPKGELEKYENLFSTMIASVRVNPVWEQAVVLLAVKINTGISMAAGERARIWQQTMQQIGEMRVRTWEKSQESLARVSQSWSRTMRGVDAYLDPTTQNRVELPTGYRNAWSNGMGEYILSPDPAYDPNVELRRGNWQRMQQIQK